MTLPPDLRKALVQAVLSNFDEPTFHNLSSDNPVGLSFQAGRIPGYSYQDAIGPYLDKIALKGTINILVEAINAENAGDDDVKAMYQLYRDMFTANGSVTKFREELFIRELMQKESALFIARDFFAVGLARMINKENISMIGLRGQSKQTGLSYVTGYLGDIESELNCFKFINLNLAEIGELYQEENITAAHIAEKIASRLNMPFSGIKDFKLAPFLFTLEARLLELANNNEKWLFFFDQFSEHFTNDIKILLKTVGRIIKNHPNALYLLFSTYKNWENDWGDELSELVELLDFRPFTEAEIELYLDKLYNNKKVNFRGISKATFLEGAKTLLPSSLYDTSHGSNVPVISRAMRSWFKGMKKTLPV